VDATDARRVAYRGTAGPLSPGGALTVEACTVVGKVHAARVERASNALFVAALAPAGDPWAAPLWVDRRQVGCVRFSYVPRGSLTPRRHRCQPEDGGPPVRPRFTSLRFGQPGYAQLRAATPPAIRRGGDDEGEMGALHALHQPQRETNLRERLDEYLRFGLEAGVFFAT
jgi:hypothetical protein